MLEKCADDLDRAGQLQNQANEQAIAARRRLEARRIQAVQTARDDGDFDGLHCVVCEVYIPARRRRQHHQMHCTPCAQAIETKNKRMRT